MTLRRAPQRHLSAVEVDQPEAAPDEPPAPEAPDHLSERSAAFWRGVVADYELDGHDLELLRRACETMDRADTAREAIDTDGLMVADRWNQLKAHPAAAVERQATNLLRLLLRELDLDGEPTREVRGPRPRRSA